jgi:hypothetical protein
MSAATLITIITAILGDVPSLFAALSSFVHAIEGTTSPGTPYVPIGSQIATDTAALEAQLQGKPNTP